MKIERIAETDQRKAADAVAYIDDDGDLRVTDKDETVCIGKVRGGKETLVVGDAHWNPEEQPYENLLFPGDTIKITF